MAGSLDGRVAIITGAGDGIGAATARRFVAEGARVVVTDRSGQAAGLIDELGPERVAYLRVDLGHADDAARLVPFALERFGRLDTLFANAGIMPAGTVTSQDLDDFRMTLEVNTTSVFVLSRAAAPHLPDGRGSIVICASVQGLQGHGDRVGYNASKGALIAMTRAMAVDLAPRGVRVNAVAPGTIDTPMLWAHLDSVPDRDAEMRDLVRFHPLARIGRPDEVAAAVLFLAGDESSFITGVTLPVDGGYTMAKT
jgi:meso-butanediol dehydrogenase/(S,S)-butanediol dehydrogenase/diacetyl reductase